MDELLLEYADLFDENFPTAIMNGYEEDELIKILKECISNKKKFNVDYDSKRIY